MNVQELLECIAGIPDYAVIVCVWPWPDGGWKAGCILIDHEYAKDQELKIGSLQEVSSDKYTWDIFDGFKYGINTHSPTLYEAVETLWIELNKDYSHA